MLARLALAFLLLLAPALRLAAADSEPAPGWLGRLVSWATGGQVRTAGLHVGIGGALTADRVDLEDKDGVWLTIEGAALELQPRRLFVGELRIDRLTIAHMTLARMPVSSGGGSGSLPLHVILTNGHLDRFDVAKPVIGQAAALSLDASADLPSLQQATFDLTAHTLDDGGAYHLAGSIAPASMQVRVNASEPAGGLIARIAGLREAVPLTIAGSAHGPFDATATDFSVAAGDLHVTESGAVNLNDRSGDVQLNASLPAMTPLADVSWQSASLQAHVSGSIAQPHASGTLAIAGLATPDGAIDKLEAEVNGDLGRFTTQATLTGVHAPEKIQKLLPPAPVLLDAEIALNEPGKFDRLTTTASMNMGGLRVGGSGSVDIAGRSADLNLSASAPAMTPVENISWQSASLQAHVTGTLAQPGASGTIGIDGLAAEGATADKVDARVSGDLTRVLVQATLTGLRTPGPQADLFAAAPVVIDATADLSGPGRPVQLTIAHPLLDASATARTAGEIGGDVTMRLKDLAAFAPGVRGALTVNGHLVPADDFSLTADASGDLAMGAMPAAAVQATLRARGLEATPAAELSVIATQGGNRVKVDASLDERGQARLQFASDAYAAHTSAAAGYDLRTKLLSLSALTADWQGQHVALQSPATVSLADGVRIDRLRLGVANATLDVSGRAAPSLDLTASLHNLSASVADQFVPNLGARGTVNADVRLTGSFAQPAGTIRVVGSGLRLATGAAASFPAANVTATATLAGTAARLNATATAGSVHLNLTGSAPLAATGALDLHATGNLDLALLNRVLAARGTIVHGQATLDATINGGLTAPRAQGTLRVAGGEVQDVVHGVHLQAITANLQAQGDSIRIERLSARAGSGTIDANGSIGLAAPLPVNLTITARNARPLASDLVTTVLDANLTLRGDVMNALTIGGDITLDDTEIRVPERLPSSVAVLKIVNANAPPPPPPLFSLANVDLDLTLQAPSRVFVRGRGLDSEFYGRFQIGGTAAAPRPNGRLRLRRGTFNLVGKTLTFSNGTIGLDGSGRVDPTLDFTASNITGDTTSTLAISGYASDPKFTLTSSPPLPQDEVLSRLLFGQSASSLGVFQLAGIATGIAQLTGVGGGLNPLDKLRSGSGLSYLNVGGQGTGASVSAGREIANRVTIGARQSMSGQGAQATMQIDLGRGFKLETALGTGGSTATTTGDSGGSSVGLSWEFQY